MKIVKLINQGNQYSVYSKGNHSFMYTYMNTVHDLLTGKKMLNNLNE